MDNLSTHQKILRYRGLASMVSDVFTDTFVLRLYYVYNMAIR